MSAKIIIANSADQALESGISHLSLTGQLRDSRNGPVLVATGPVITEYRRPANRLVFNRHRDANHVFHLMETIWMLAGQNDVSWLLNYNSNFGQFAEEDGIQHGAYGHRWRRYFGRDQLEGVIRELLIPGSRRAVLQMWDCASDLNAEVSDVPCNTHAYFQITPRGLEMSVCCRSNDIIWGAYGANAVHFSMLQELLALHLQVPLGPYYQISNNYHMYIDMGPGPLLLEKWRDGGWESIDPYHCGEYSYPLLQSGETFWDFVADCKAFVTNRSAALTTHFMRRVARPLQMAYLRRKADIKWDIDDIAPCDFRTAFSEWAARRDNERK